MLYTRNYRKHRFESAFFGIYSETTYYKYLSKKKNNFFFIIFRYYRLHIIIIIAINFKWPFNSELYAYLQIVETVSPLLLVGLLRLSFLKRFDLFFKSLDVTETEFFITKLRVYIFLKMFHVKPNIPLIYRWFLCT